MILLSGLEEMRFLKKKKKEFIWDWRAVQIIYVMILWLQKCECICIYILCCIFHRNYHARTFSFMGFQVVFVSSKSFFLTGKRSVSGVLEAPCVCAKAAEPVHCHTWPPQKGLKLMQTVREHLQDIHSLFKQLPGAVNCGFRKTRVFCRGWEALVAPGGRAADSAPAAAPLRTRRQPVPPSGAGCYYKFPSHLAYIS